MLKKENKVRESFKKNFVSAIDPCLLFASNYISSKRCFTCYFQISFQQLLESRILISNPTYISPGY